jgi:hypothetical protein
MSNLADNTTRGLLAEYIVACALALMTACEVRGMRSTCGRLPA